MLFHALHHPSTTETKYWKNLHGGKETLRSFQATVPQEIDQKYIDFMVSMPYFIEKDKFILVHAGLNLKHEDPLSEKETMLWGNENSNINQEWLDKRIIIHGHRIRPRQRIQKNIQELHTFPILGIDNGCVYPYDDYHHLCAIELNNMELYFQENIDVSNL
jgi:serine/threonine protein phosphatase 1